MGVAMITVRKYRGSFRDYGNRILSRFRYVYFGRLQNRRVAIVSNRKFNLNSRDIVTVVEERKLPLHIVDMNMRMGKGYKSTEVTSRNYNFLVEDTFTEGLLYEVYELV